MALQEYYIDPADRPPRCYQLIAINKSVDAIVRGERRILLVMATGTGKTYTAFQIIWRLWKAGAVKRVLFLVDRNILADQTMIGDIKPFKSAMAKLSSRNNSIEKRDGTLVKLASGVSQDRKIDKAYEIYLSLYQAVTGAEEEDDLFRQFSPGFFDLVVVDECHRGSAADDAAWRRVLEYFSSAAQIGLTATPKETKDVSNSAYFGDPIYTYSLKQGIENGFLAPYKVVRIGFDRDLEWRPERGKLDKFIDPESPYPVIATTSRLMTSGVDARTCRLIVLDRGIESMTEFKLAAGLRPDLVARELRIIRDELGCNAIRICGRDIGRPLRGCGSRRAAPSAMSAARPLRSPGSFACSIRPASRAPSGR